MPADLNTSLAQVIERQPQLVPKDWLYPTTFEDAFGWFFTVEGKRFPLDADDTCNAIALSMLNALPEGTCAYPKYGGGICIESQLGSSIRRFHGDNWTEALLAFWESREPATGAAHAG